MSDNVIKPPYTSYRSFNNLINEFREYPVLPTVIDRSLLSKRSGSEQSALIATLKWFRLIEDNGSPTQLLKDYIAADEESSKTLLKQMVESSYSQVTDDSFNLEKATSALLADQFRQYHISGSTLTKSISFFLSAAKDVGIPISPHVKPPPAKNGTPRRKPKDSHELPPNSPTTNLKTPRPPREDMVAIPIPIYGGKNGVVYLPGDMTASQWTNVIKMTEFILQNYRDTMGSEAPKGGED